MFLLFDIDMRNRVYLHDEQNEFDAHVFEVSATIRWSASSEDFKFVTVSDRVVLRMFKIMNADVPWHTRVTHSSTKNNRAYTSAVAGCPCS